jgi:hypothetical protein
VETIYNWEGHEKIRTMGIGEAEVVELEISYLSTLDTLLTYQLSLQFQKQTFPFMFGQTLKENDRVISTRPLAEVSAHMRNGWGTFWQSEVEEKLPRSILTYVKDRWQMLDENFMPPLRLPPGQTGSLNLIDRQATNVIFMLDYMRQVQPELYDKLQEDFGWLLTQVDHIETERTDHETRLLLKEKAHPQHAAPTISSGTARLLAMLTAYYALDMRDAHMPGLVVIEEPDTALNPGLLGNFVEQLRNYVEGEYPRQFILTTHNPAFLDHFEPEEVRIVERDEEGYTRVRKIPDHVKEIWLDEYGLGEVWTTNSLGGLAE